ncbi:MAG: L-seryl-tRNA(Sec) selenium transferase [Nitrospinae bacterium]|nr:L-seryl-tRNA(Sec) selenium transferase [Nitrospinota bacterium]
MSDAKLRLLPSIDRLSQCHDAVELIGQFGRESVLNALRETLNEARKNILSGSDGYSMPENDPSWLRRVKEILEGMTAPRLKRVINCTGVVIHTNLGRALLAESAAQAARLAGESNVNLEFDLDKGARGDRDTLVEELIIAHTGAQAATAVNNNAAAVLLALNTFAPGKEVIVSRGELIEIGGSFRLPEIMARSGCVLREVGTTNRTHLKDYEEAVNDNTGMILRAHTSNYRIIGFTTQPSTKELAELANRKGIPFMVDLGSGAILDMAVYGLPHEPTVKETLEEGAGIVTISGDKLLGGPQAGILAGDKNLITAINKNHLKRALRLDKMILAALEATLRLYLNPEEALRQIPTLRYLTRNLEEVRKTAGEAAAVLKTRLGDDADVFVMEDVCQAGSGSLPEMDIPSYSVAIKSKTMGPNELALWFRSQNPPVIGRVDKDLFRLDMRCVDDAEWFK